MGASNDGAGGCPRQAIRWAQAKRGHKGLEIVGDRRVIVSVDEADNLTAAIAPHAIKAVCTADLVWRVAGRRDRSIPPHMDRWLSVRIVECGQRRARSSPHGPMGQATNEADTE